MVENWLTVKKGSLWPPQYTYCPDSCITLWCKNIINKTHCHVWQIITSDTSNRPLKSPFSMEVCVAFFVCFFFAVTYSSGEFYFNFLPVQHLPGNQVILGKEYHTMLKKKSRKNNKSEKVSTVCSVLQTLSHDNYSKNSRGTMEITASGKYLPSCSNWVNLMHVN